MNGDQIYRHTQRAPLCLLLYALAILFFVLTCALWNAPPIRWTFPAVGVLMLGLASAFHYLRVEDEGEALAISFGPIPLFRRTVRYKDIASAEVGRTTLLDGWGIHMSMRGGWVWNIWGRDCVVLRLHDGVLRVGSDDAEQLTDFLNTRLSLGARTDSSD